MGSHKWLLPMPMSQGWASVASYLLVISRWVWTRLLSKITASSLGPAACEILCTPFKNGLSISHSPLGLLKVSSTGLQSQTFWGLSSQYKTRRPGSLMWGLDPLFLRENLCNCNYPPFVGCPSGVWVLTILHLHSFYLSCCGSFFIFLVGEDLFC